MNILIIPSWYPWHGEPLRGIFLKEQAVGIGRVRPDWRIAVAVWGQRRYTLSVRNPLKTLVVLADFAFSHFKAKKRYLLGNVCEYRRPTIEWTKKWRQGNIRGQERACRRILQRATRDFGPIDVIHAHIAFPGGWIAMKLSQSFHLPFIVTEHMGPFPFIEFCNADGTIKEIISEPLRRAQAIVAVSPFQARSITAHGFSEPLVIPNMVDERFFKPGSSKKKTGDPFVFFALSALLPAKGLQDLLQALVLLREQSSGTGPQNIQVRIGGVGEFERELHVLARRLEVTLWVRWLGRLSRRQVREEFQACDCFVHPSHLESFSIVVLEALACGKPVIATRCGGPESFMSAVNGVLVPAKEPGELARSMAEMVRSAAKYDSGTIRQNILENYSRESICAQLELLYGNVVASA